MSHQHTADPTRSSTIYLVCRCGAVKLAKVLGDNWHTCKLCVIPGGK